jgi:hypothetical protein
MTNLETLLTTLLERLNSLNLRITELEVGAEVDRKRRIAADNDLMVLLLRGDEKLKANIDLEAEEKFNAFLSNASDINGLTVELTKLENRLLYMPQDEKQRSVIVKRLDALAARVQELSERRPAILGFIAGAPPVVLQEGDSD